MKTSAKTYLLLHLLLAVYSASGILSKLAARQELLSRSFLLLYAAVIAVLALYAFGWQKALKRMPLSVAYANKAVTVVWGCVWGVLLFHEQLSVGKLIGGLLVLAGVALYGHADGEAAKE